MDNNNALGDKELFFFLIISWHHPSFWQMETNLDEHERMSMLYIIFFPNIININKFYLLISQNLACIGIQNTAELAIIFVQATWYTFAILVLNKENYQVNINKGNNFTSKEMLLTKYIHVTFTGTQLLQYKLRLNVITKSSALFTIMKEWMPPL